MTLGQKKSEMPTIPRTGGIHLTRPRGFSLLELVAALVVLGVLGGLAISRLAGNSLESRRAACYTMVGNIEVQVELWHRNKGTWPAGDLSDIGNDPAYFPDGPPKCPVDGSRYVLDGTTHRVVGHEHPLP